MIYIRDLSFQGEMQEADLDYEKKIPFIANMWQKGQEISFRQAVTFFVGENGLGKSTLLESLAVAYGFNPEGGSKNFNFKTNEEEYGLSKYLRLVKSPYRAKDGFFYRGESFFNASTYIEDLELEEQYGEKSLHKQSHGQGFLSLIENRFWGQGLYILDEPESALSPLSLMSFLYSIKKLVDQDSQFIISTHSPILLSYPGADIYEIKGNEINKTPLEEVEHYRITKEFLENPQRMLKYLFLEEKKIDI